MTYLSAQNAGVDDATIEKAVEIRRQHDSAVAAIKNDRRLSPEGKTQALAKAQLRAEREVKELQARYEQKTKERTERLVRDLFGSGIVSSSDAVSVRDAQDRVERIEDAEQAMALLQRAELSGDKVLAQAIAQKAYQASNDGLGRAFGGGGWGAVLAAYGENHPGVADKVVELQANQPSVAKGLSQAFIFGAPPRPTELGNLPEDRLQALADGE
jgi:hypothetical protein